MGRPSIWIMKRKNEKGEWRYVVRWMERESGKNRGKTFDKREEADDFKAKLRRDIVNEEYGVPVKISYKAWVNMHLYEMENSVDIDVAPKTISAHKEALEALGRECKPRSPSAINPKMIRVFRKRQLEKGLAIGTVNKHIRAIRSALSYAVRAGIIPSNKLLGPHRLLLREEKEPPRILKVEDAKMLLNMAKDLRLKTVLSLAYYHGLRRKEICYLRWENVDFSGNMLNIINSSAVRTKTRVSRSVFLRKETADLLSELRKQNTGQFVFENPESFYWLVGKYFEKTVGDAGLDHCTLHDLRKTCNTLMKENGVSLEAAMQVLGHSTIKVNQQCYTGILTRQQKAAVNSLPSIG